jgi:hypothetical protein
MIGGLSCGLALCRLAALDVTRILDPSLQDPYGGRATQQYSQHRPCRITILGEVHHSLPCTRGSKTALGGATAQRLLIALCPDGGAKIEDSFSAQSFLLDSRFSTSPARSNPLLARQGASALQLKMSRRNFIPPQTLVSRIDLSFFPSANETSDYARGMVYQIVYDCAACSLCACK